MSETMVITATAVEEEKPATAAKHSRINPRFAPVLDFSRRSAKLLKNSDKKREETLETKKKRQLKYYTSNKHGTVGCIIREPRLKRKCKEIIAKNSEVLRDFTMEFFGGIEPKFQQTTNARKVTLKNLDHKNTKLWEMVQIVSTNHRNKHIQRPVERHVDVAWVLLESK
jgi:hypothetical protein